MERGEGSVRRLFLRGKWGSDRSDAGRGRPSPARACRDPTPVSGGGRRPADARGGVGAGERRGGENPQQNLRRSPSARLDLNGRSPRPRSAAETLESAAGRRGSAGTGRRRPGGAEGRDLAGQRIRTSRPGAVAPAAGQAGPRISPPQSEPYTEGAAEDLPQGARPSAIPTRQGPVLISGRRLVPAPAPPAAHIWKESAGGWEGGVEGRGQATGNVGGRWNPGG